MVRFFLFLALCSLGLCHGHQWESMFLETSIEQNQLVAEIQFDASSIDPETKDDPFAQARKREWLVGLSKQDHQFLRKTAQAQLQQSLAFRDNQGNLLSLQFSFPDWQQSPPAFPKRLDQFAFFTVVCRGPLPTRGHVSCSNSGATPSPTITLQLTDQQDQESFF